jgi:hypothetical protein
MDDATNHHHRRPESDLLQLTDSECVQAQQRDEEHRLAKLGHAVDFLNHHLPAFGFMHPENFAGGGLIADSMPEEIKGELVDALVAAARYARRMFEEGDEEGADEAE